jgi:hypothetical protein
MVTAGLVAKSSVPDLRPQHPQEQARERLRVLRQRGKVMGESIGILSPVFPSLFLEGSY